MRRLGQGDRGPAPGCAFRHCEASSMQIALVGLAVAANLVLTALWVVDVSPGSVIFVAPVAVLAAAPLAVRTRRKLFRATAVVVSLLYLVLVGLVFFYALWLLPSALLLGVSAALPRPRPATVRRRALLRALSGTLLLTILLAFVLISLDVLR